MRFIKFFIFGLLTALGALCVELVISNMPFILSGNSADTNQLFNRLTLLVVVAVLIEETFKYIILAKLYSTPNIQTPRISTAFVFGLGFSMLETFSILDRALPFYNTYFDLQLWGMIFIHIATSGTIGILILKKNISPIKIISLTFILHLIYNLLVIYDMGYFLIYLYLIIIYFMLAIFNQKLSFQKTSA